LSTQRRSTKLLALLSRMPKRKIENRMQMRMKRVKRKQPRKTILSTRPRLFRRSKNSSTSESQMCTISMKLLISMRNYMIKSKYKFQTQSG